MVGRPLWSHAEAQSRRGGRRVGAPGLQGCGVVANRGFDRMVQISRRGIVVERPPSPQPAPPQRWVLPHEPHPACGHPLPLPRARDTGEEEVVPALDGFGAVGFACAVVEPEARRYTKMSKKGRVPLIPAIRGNPGNPIVPGIPTLPNSPGIRSPPFPIRVDWCSFVVTAPPAFSLASV